MRCAVSIGGERYREDETVIEEGKPAPDFELTSDNGERVKLSDLRGKPVVLYFYPKDDTPGCTTQACGIRDAYGEFERAGAVVLGVSPDDEASHVKFRSKYDLPFTLLADTDHAVAEQFVKPVHREMFIADADPELLLERLLAYQVPMVDKWLGREET